MCISMTRTTKVSAGGFGQFSEVMNLYLDTIWRNGQVKNFESEFKYPDFTPELSVSDG